MSWLDPGHVPLLLTVKIGPGAGTTSTSCTCGWDRTYKTRVVAVRETNQHLTMNGLPKLRKGY